MKRLITSSITGKTYAPEDCVRLLNIRQVIFYMKKGIQILDFYPSKDYKTGQEVMVFMVDKKESQPYYNEWLGYRFEDR